MIANPILELEQDLPTEDVSSVRVKAIKAVHRIINGTQERVEKKVKFTFKSIAKEAQISPTELLEGFSEVMDYVQSIKQQPESRVTPHAVNARNRCNEAIDRILDGNPLTISKSANLNVANVAKEANIDDSYIYQALPDILNRVHELKKGQVFGNKATNALLVKTLDQMIQNGREITVKSVCRAAGLNKSFDCNVRKSYPDVHKKIREAIHKQSSEKRTLERTELLAAVERLKAGKPVNVEPLPKGILLSIKKLMRESGIHESTIVRHHKDIADICLNTRIESDEYSWVISDKEREKLGGSSNVRLNFGAIEQCWMRDAAKEFITDCMMSRSSSTLQANLQALRMFSEALNEIHSNIEPNKINRKVITDVLFLWRKRDITTSTIKRRMSALRQFFEWCIETGSVKFQSVVLMKDTDYPKIEKTLPRFISEKVMAQLNANIDGLSPPIMRLFLVLQEVGMRISECISLKYDCIYPDKDGDYFMKYYQFKMKKEHVVPISKELVSVIKEQQASVIEDFNKKLAILFPTPPLQNCKKRKYVRAGKTWSQGTLIKHLNVLAQERNITGEDGQIYHFSFHPFRHTVATRMINNGVPQHIVQRYLGHETPTMTSVYAHIMDQTLKKEFAKFQGKMVDNNGKVYEAEDVVTSLAEGIDPNELDNQWIKKNIAVQSLPNGLCSLPIVQGGCPHANSCLTCPNFRTDHRYLPQHKAQLNKTEKIIVTCKANGWQRQLEMNERLKQSLVNIIEPLEAVNNDS